jgi:hypothetical protein
VLDQGWLSSRLAPSQTTADSNERRTPAIKPVRNPPRKVSIDTIAPVAAPRVLCLVTLRLDHVQAHDMHRASQTTPKETLLVKSRPLNFQEHRRALLHTAATVSLTFHCRMQGGHPERFCIMYYPQSGEFDEGPQRGPAMWRKGLKALETPCCRRVGVMTSSLLWCMARDTGGTGRTLLTVCR